jgi:hypothetical protein
LQIAIQLSKLLSSAHVPSFYPSQFVLVTDLLDAFGRLVSARLLTKANEERAVAGLSPLSPVFRVNDVPEGTRETARNWFYKIASIRELLPRFYGLSLSPQS